MYKKIYTLIVIFLLLCISSYAYAQREIGRTDFGWINSGDRPGTMVWNGGTNCCSDQSGSHVCSLTCPGFDASAGYAANGSTIVIYYRWVDPRGILRISSGPADGSARSASGGFHMTYGIPSDTGFDIESSGYNVADLS